jgi:hypothetical protein
MNLYLDIVAYVGMYWTCSENGSEKESSGNVRE